MERDAARACEAVRSLGRRGRTTRVPDEVRQVVLAYVRRARRDGVSWEQIAETVRLSKTALVRWTKAERRSRRRALQPVRVVAERLQEPGQVSLVTAAGHRVEGLSVEGAAALLRALG